MSLKKPVPQQFNIDDARELLKIDLKNGVYEADTDEERRDELKIIEQMRIAGVPAQSLDEIGKLPEPYVSPTKPKRASPKISLVVEEYLKDAKLALAESTVYKQRQSFKQFVNAHSDQSIAEFGKEEVKSFKARLLASEKTGHTVNQYLSHIRSLFEFAVGHGYYFEENPVDGLLVKGAKKVVTPREQFRHNELKEIFKWENYEWLTLNKPDYFSGPLICLFQAYALRKQRRYALATSKRMAEFYFQGSRCKNAIRQP